jgi:hypothetical protein
MTNRTYILGGVVVVVAVILGTLSPFLALAFIIFTGFLVLAVKNAPAAVLLVYATKPIIDAAWDVRIPGIGLNFLQIVSAAFPILALIIMRFNRPQVPLHPVLTSWKILVGWNLFAVIVIAVTNMQSGLALPDGYIVRNAAVFFQFLNSYIAFALVPYLFATEELRKRFILVVMFAGLFPLITAFLQLGGIIQGRLLRTTGDLIRISALYHDSTNLRIYSFQTILAILTYLGAYWSASLSRAHWKAFFALIQIPFLLVVIYRGYSKAAIAIILAWGALLLFMSRQRVFVSLLFGTVLFFVVTTDNRIIDEIESLFRKEIWYAEGQLHENLQYTLLGGRFVYWGSALDNFVDQELAVQLVGIDYVRAASLHNDFLRTLMATGAIGLILYVFLLLQMMWHVVLRTVNRSSKLALPALLALTAFIIDSLGLVPLLYPGYSWVTFGIISMTLHPTLIETTPKRSAV